MHVSSLSVDLHWFLQIVLTALAGALALRYLLKNTASKYFVVDANSDPIDSSSSFLSSSSSSSSSSQTSFGVGSMPGASGAGGCAVCGKPTSKQCSRCKAVKYCSESCQSAHWREEHKSTCKTLHSSGRGVRVLPSNGFRIVQKQVDKILFPYDEFVKLYDWDKPGFRPCGLLNCGNSCYANVVLQCLAHTRPLVAYLMDKGHRRECKRNEWCFLCELESHLQRASLQQPFSPLNILSRLASIGNNLGYGKQEDAHEFMRFAIDTMQSICLDEHGGEKLIHPKSQETTLIQHIFGGQLQSQILCMQCNQVSNQYENMMDLTVEMQGDVTSLEECLDQFTMKERLHGDNMYKCDGCNDYVKAWKCLTIRQAPNILTIALKRFQSGRFGKLNKRITFPENLNLSPYMSEEGDQTDKYKLYAVVVHVDMLNASYFGHYICYIKDFQGVWYRVDDCKVTRVELDHVLSQRAYMLLYSRMSARATCLKTFGAPKKLEESHMAGAEPDQFCFERSGNSTDKEQISFYTSSHSPPSDITTSSQSSVLVKGPTSPLSRDIQDNSEANIVTSQPFSNGSCLENSCSQEIAPSFSSTVNSLVSNGDYSTYERQEVRNPVQLPEPANSTEELESENHLPLSCYSGFSVPQGDKSFVTLDEPGADSQTNGSCNTAACSDPPCKRDINCGSLSSSNIVVERPGSKRCQSQMENAVISTPVDRGSRVPAHAILGEMAPGSDGRESEKCQPGIDVGVLETNGPCKLANASCKPYDLYESASCVNNGLDEPSSSSQKHYTSLLNMEVDATEVNKLLQRG